GARAGTAAPPARPAARLEASATTARVVARTVRRDRTARRRRDRGPPIPPAGRSREPPRPADRGCRSRVTSVSACRVAPRSGVLLQPHLRDIAVEREEHEDAVLDLRRVED